MCCRRRFGLLPGEPKLADAVFYMYDGLYVASDSSSGFCGGCMIPAADHLVVRWLLPTVPSAVVADPPILRLAAVIRGMTWNVLTCTSSILLIKDSGSSVFGRPG